MSSPSKFGSEQPHLVSLVLHSKKALQHGEQLCSKARLVSMQSAQVAVDVLALNAKVRWITNAVLEQLKLAAGVAKSIEQRRSQLEGQAREWDVVRNQRTTALDNVLDSLGLQRVPPDFHSGSPESSLFGSQHGSDDEHENTPFADPNPGQSPTETLRNVLRNGIKNQRTHNNDRSRWKTLRDFVDERAIEDLLDTMESDRNALDDTLAKTSDYPESLLGTISAIRNALPTEISIPPMDHIFASQEGASTDMASHLSGLMNHFDQMSHALHDSEAGEEFGEADIQAMNRDTDELPAIISDLERNLTSIEASHDQLITAKAQTQGQLESHRITLNDLDELGDIISEMLERQDMVENDSAEQLEILNATLSNVEDLHSRYTSYQHSYCKLVIELARRKQYREAAAKIVQGMMIELQAMAEEEQQRREEFNTEHGPHLPSDVCLSIPNMPTKWEVIPWNHEPEEEIPDIAQDLLEEAMHRASSTENKLSASLSI